MDILEAKMQIRIHKDAWDVVIIDSRDDKMNPGCEYQYMGLCEYNRLQISIADDLPASVARAVVIHELTHAYMSSYGYNITESEGICDFFGAHGDEIIAHADQIMRKVITSANNSRDSNIHI